MRTYRKHQLAWCRVWRPYCVEHDLDPWAYNMHAAADCLSRVQERSKEYAAANGTKEQHSSFKEARAAITAFWRLVHPHTNLATAYFLTEKTLTLIDRPTLAWTFQIEAPCPVWRCTSQ